MKSQRSQLRRKSKSFQNDIVNIELDIKCSCSQLTSNDNATIQFTRRYLRGQSSMPIRIIRLFIEAILFYSPTTKIFIYDINNRLLKDSDRLRSLKHERSSSLSSYYIPLRFQLTNTVTSLTNCSCLSATVEENTPSSSLPMIIQQKNMERTLFTLSSSSLNLSENSMDVSHSEYGIPQPIDFESELSTTNQIISVRDEPFPTSTKQKRYHESKYVTLEVSLDIPLDLRIKKNL